MDIVYPLRRAGHNRELRYSLRSLVNLPHDSVFIAGEIQPWVRNVTHISLPQRDTKYANARANILAAARDERVSDDFILMNDDFYVLSPQETVAPMHQGDMDAFMATFPHRRAYWELMVSTRELLQSLGITRPKFYELHVPTVYNKRKLLEMVDRFDGREYMMRTVYHNLYRSGGRKRDDVKKHKVGQEITETDYLSSSNAMIKRQSFKSYLHARFPERSVYEA
ncbi:hypothetical protein [Amorphus orientalis]|uniref:Uncharacterized protein n=1 Tax=Amorphus orientalis TaxID=649198 RepID=A0AAE3VR24_9HYPH|nr:hypothetical protein [Amorphus orientalis]MDQ0316413.1 hypothetical protein [Amorphus orientalis]